MPFGLADGLGIVFGSEPFDATETASPIEEIEPVVRHVMSPDRIGGHPAPDLSRIRPKWLTKSYDRRYLSDLSTVLAATVSRGRHPLDIGIADAIVVADPVHPAAPALDRSAVADVNLPARRIGLPRIVDRALHRALLLVHATFLPLADEADVEEDGITQGRELRIGAHADC